MKYLDIFTYGRNISERSFLVCKECHSFLVAERCALGSNVLINSLHWRILWILCFSSMFPSCVPRCLINPTYIPDILHGRFSATGRFFDRGIRPAFRSVVKSISRRCRRNEKTGGGIMLDSGQIGRITHVHHVGKARGRNFVMRENLWRATISGWVRGFPFEKSVGLHPRSLSIISSVVFICSFAPFLLTLLRKTFQLRESCFDEKFTSIGSLIIEMVF